jgi:putative transposase
MNAEGLPGALLSPHDEFRRLGANDVERRAAYAKLFGSSLDTKRIEEIRSATNGNFALGDATFRRQLAARLGRRVEAGSPGRPAAQQGKGDLFLI